ncbi:hypothetical protein BD413DRAFT_306534 [Trametes elegans]|nr:hypothetical protein BD413DRAFT_306534 [Trametes elegans]
MQEHPRMVSAGLQVLLCDDILEGVVLHIAYGPYREARGTAWTLCVVCKAFYHPAVKVLWSDLSSMLPLLRLLRGFTEQWQAAHHRRGDSITLTERGAEATWTQVRGLASCVPTLTHRKMGMVNEQAWKYFNGLCGGAPLLPALQSVICGNKIHEDWSCCLRRLHCGSTLLGPRFS